MRFIERQATVPVSPKDTALMTLIIGGASSTQVQDSNGKEMPDEKGKLPFYEP